MSISRRDFFKRSLVAGAGAAAATMVGPLALEAAANTAKKRIRKAKRVIIMTFDGIRVDGLLQAYTPNIDKLIDAGAVSYTTRDVMPSITLPNYTSHLCGAGPEVHGVADNGWKVDKFKLEVPMELLLRGNQDTRANCIRDPPARRRDGRRRG